MAQRVILHHRKMGIYLGSCLGFGFWSKLDPAGQDAAWTFESIEHARLAIEGWDSQIENPMFTHVEVEGEFATIEQCVAVGLDAWDPNKELEQPSFVHRSDCGMPDCFICYGGKFK